MKRLNPDTNEPFKYGEIREDGYRFQTYRKTLIKKNGFFSETWLHPEKFEKALLRTKLWQEKNLNVKETNIKKSMWRKENPDKMKIYREAWKKENPDALTALAAKRRAAKLQRTPAWLTKEQLLEIQSFYTKAKEMQALTGVEHHVDHIVPLQGKNISGLHVPWNLQVISAIENVKKGNRWD